MPKSPWKELKKEISFPKLNKDLEVDIAIVGGGLAGISTAYSLISSGKKIALIEKKEIGSGATEYTTAMVTQVIDTSLSDLTKMFGEEKTKLVWRAGCEAIDRLENIIATEKIDCDFMRCPGYCYAQKPDQLPGLRQDYETATKLDF